MRVILVHIYHKSRIVQEWKEIYNEKDKYHTK